MPVTLDLHYLSSADQQVLIDAAANLAQAEERASQAKERASQARALAANAELRLRDAQQRGKFTQLSNILD